MLSHIKLLRTVALVLIVAPISLARGGELEDLLAAGKHDEAAEMLSAKLEAAPDERLRTQLGIVQFLQGVQGLADDLHRYGLYSQQWMGAPLLRLPVEYNTDPEPMSYDDFRGAVERFGKRLQTAEQTLGSVNRNTNKWRIALSKLAIDLNENNEIGESENLLAILYRINDPRQRGAGPLPQDVQTKVAFDYADTVWLQGYCNVMIAVTEMVLAYDQREMFELTGHIAFRGAQTRYDFLHPGSGNLWADIPDFIAAIHLIDFPLRDAERMKSAHAHLLKTISLSRTMWKEVRAETDDDSEWIAGPNQGLALRRYGFSVTDEQAESWPQILDETEKVLTGERLMPAPRLNSKTRGVNMKKVFHEPRDFDLVLWVQGTDLMHYVEEGKVTDFGSWRRFQRTFGGNLISFAFWAN